jgi:hypothetical protein
MELPSDGYSANIIELCPVGALTDKQYEFGFRPWEKAVIVASDAHEDNIREKEAYPSFKKTRRNPIKWFGPKVAQWMSNQHRWYNVASTQRKEYGYAMIWSDFIQIKEGSSAIICSEKETLDTRNNINKHTSSYAIAKRNGLISVPSNYTIENITNFNIPDYVIIGDGNLEENLGDCGIHFRGSFLDNSIALYKSGLDSKSKIPFPRKNSNIVLINSIESEGRDFSERIRYSARSPAIYINADLNKYSSPLMWDSVFGFNSKTINFVPKLEIQSKVAPHFIKSNVNGSSTKNRISQNSYIITKNVIDRPSVTVSPIGETCIFDNVFDAIDHKKTGHKQSPYCGVSLEHFSPQLAILYSATQIQILSGSSVGINNG